MPIHFTCCCYLGPSQYRNAVLTVYRDSHHYKDKTISRPFYLCDRILYTWKDGFCIETGHKSSTELQQLCMMTSSKGNIFRVIGPLWGSPLVTDEFPSQRPVTRSFDVSFDLRLIKQLSKQSRCRWFETPSRPLWRHGNGICTKEPIHAGPT